MSKLLVYLTLTLFIHTCIYNTSLLKESYIILNDILFANLTIMQDSCVYWHAVVVVVVFCILHDFLRTC